jgi:hypothetical protein
MLEFSLEVSVVPPRGRLSSAGLYGATSGLRRLVQREPDQRRPEQRLKINPDAIGQCVRRLKHEVARGSHIKAVVPAYGLSRNCVADQMIVYFVRLAWREHAVVSRSAFASGYGDWS